MTHLLDTNSCVEYLRRGAATPIAMRVAAAPAGSVVLCSLVVAELIYGALRSVQAQTLPQVRAFCNRFISLPFDDRCAEEYGDIRAYLESLGTPIGPNDTLIAAIARANGLILVTHNTSEFSRVPGLTIEDWQVP